MTQRTQGQHVDLPTASGQTASDSMRADKQGQAVLTDLIVDLPRAPGLGGLQSQAPGPGFTAGVGHTHVMIPTVNQRP